MEKYTTDTEISKFEDIDLLKTYTFADYLKWPFDERVELIKGKIFPMSGPGTSHQRVSQRLSAKLYNFLENKSCEVFTAPFDIRWPRRSKEDKEILTVLQPDICVICDPSKIDEWGCIGDPDIVVEILSPGNYQKELKNKYEVYEEAGVLEYWIIHPEEKTFMKYSLNVDGKFQLSHLLTLGDEITSSILPDFTLSLDEFFRD